MEARLRKLKHDPMLPVLTEVPDLVAAIRGYKASETCYSSSCRSATTAARTRSASVRSSRSCSMTDSACFMCSDEAAGLLQRLVEHGPLAMQCLEAGAQVERHRLGA